MRLTQISFLLIVATGLGGCVTNRYCATTQPYENARSVPLIQPTEGLKVPESATAMRVPAETETKDLPFGVKVQDPKRPSKTRYQCLDQPPTLPATPVGAKPVS